MLITKLWNWLICKFKVGLPTALLKKAMESVTSLAPAMPVAALRKVA
jgi:hypothetical protein